MISNNSFVLLLLMAVLIAVSPLRAQIVGGMNENNSANWGGNNFVVGTVFWPDGTPVNTRISIRLRSMTKGEILATTDDAGRFSFSRLSAGLYSFTIEASDQYESISQEVEVVQTRNPVPQTYTLTIRLRAKFNLNAKPAVISTEAAGIPKKAIELYEKALKLSQSKDAKGAIEQLKLAVAEYPQFTSAFNEMGVQYMQLNDLEKADESLQSALKIKPKAFEPLLNLGIVLFRLKKFTDAEPVLRLALEVDEKSAVGHYYLGRLLTSTENFVEAEKELNLALTLSNNQMNEAHRMLANLFIAKADYKKAMSELETYLQLVPNAPDAEKLRGVISQLKNAPAPNQ